MVTINTQKDETCPGSEDGQVVVHPEGGKAPYSYDWDNGSDKANNDKLSAGEYTVIVTDADGNIAMLTVVIGLENEACASKNPTAGVKSTIVRTFPTAFNDILNIEIESAYSSKLEVTMFDMNGKLVRHENGQSLSVGENSLTLQVGDLAPDIYLVIVKTDKEQFVHKVISSK
ncbi:T9SS type A sorting domain-containing protein [Maribacter litopenaei]|uniref:T9SS type A sorting domain-containing protein n=1 Tax=Maribacter litopenaei TaxID=2976127 RepID=A0ABY5YC02_9FLAO|nr:T9SS type A sorting domain-containing protein [Maribacter litopenaei]